MGIAFTTEFEPRYGQRVDISPLIRRVVAHNPNPGITPRRQRDTRSALRTSMCRLASVQALGRYSAGASGAAAGAIGAP